VPKANVQHLMLREDVVEAVKEGKFAVHAVETIDQGIEILTGVKAGTRGDDGEFEAGSVNRRVEETLRSFAERGRAFARRSEGGDGAGSAGNDSGKPSS